MDPISLGAMPKADFTAAMEPPVPQPPDAADVQEFQSLYNQEAGPVQAAPHAQSFQGMLIHMIGGTMPGQVPDNIFEAAMGRMVEMHEKSCAQMETLMERVASSQGMTPQEMLEAQMIMSNATTGLATYQAFDKKADEGIKALMTGQ
jgi:hypothetical protein